MPDELSLNQVEGIIREATQGFFEESDEHLRVSLRVSVEFQRFLLKHPVEPAPSELSYIMGTVQSAVDSFFLVGHTCRVFSGVEESWVPEQTLPSGFMEVRTAFLSHFDVLTHPRSTPVHRLGSLLSLLRIQLAFMAYFFPWGENAPTGDRSVPNPGQPSGRLAR